jgi:type I restriction enzyme, S subunit
MFDLGPLKIGDLVNVTDYVANGSFAALKENVSVSDEPDFAVLVRLVDFNRGWTPPFSYVTEASYQFLKKSSLEVGDVVISNVGANAGTVFKVPDLGIPCTLGPNSVVCKIAEDALLDRDYFFYFLKSPFGQHLLSRIRGGSAQPKFNKTDLRSIEINIPDKRSQKAIAHILGTLDDKIELNQKLNQTLEGIAKAIFKSWFVDFDPVRAKAEGRSTNLPPEISDLFPDELVDSEIGEIPRGWEVKSIDQIGVFRNGLALQKFPAVDGEEIFPVVKIAQLRKGNTTGDDLYASGIGEDFIIDDGDFIFSWSGSLLAKFWVGGKGALNQHLFKVEGMGCPLWFVAGWVQRHMPEFQSIAEGKVTTMGHIKREHLTQARCTVPNIKTLEKAESYIKTLVDRKILAQQETRTLSELRDTLLPKLISGELRIPDAERFLEEAGI